MSTRKILLAVGIMFFCACNSGIKECFDCKGLAERSPQTMNSVDTLPIYAEGCKEKLVITGTVFQQDGKTLAPDVILYIYHTNEKGKYPTKGNEKGMAKEHGYNRGWIKTGTDGKYQFVTCKPGHYPNGRDAMHIHVILKESDKQPYWIGDYLFEGDPKLTPERIAMMKDRGGSGVVQLQQTGNNEWSCKRDIYLGLNIPL